MIECWVKNDSEMVICPLMQLLDENKQLIVAIMEYQSQGRAAESIA